MSNNALGLALDYLTAGLSVIPIHTDGTKSPAMIKGHPVLMRQRIATDDEARKWWKHGAAGIGVLCGTVSGNAECIDFDRKDIFAEWYAAAAAQIVGLIDKLCIIETPRGYHAWYRCEKLVDGSQKLAQEPVLSEGKIAVKTLIETRGEGGYAIVPGGPKEVHESKKPYKHSEGRPLIQLHVFTVNERNILLNAARCFNRHADEPKTKSEPAEQADGLRPGDDYNRSGPPWEQILEPHGWKCLRSIGKTQCWQRPGKDKGGHSATTGACTAADGSDLFYVFSSNAHPFQDGKGYSKFRAFAVLNHAGNLSHAAGELAAEGFGKAEAPSARRTLDKHHAVPATAKPIVGLPGPDESFTAAELMRMRLPPTRWAVTDLIPEGLTILAGRPKAGKSWLALHIACQIAQGGTVLQAIKVEAGPVLYLAMEDNKRRLQGRLNKILDSQPPENLHLRLKWPRMQEGGAVHLRAFIAQWKPRLVIVDTLAKIRSHHGRTDDHYAADYDFISQLAEVANKENTAILCLHHTSKSIRNDPVDEISGTLGLSAAADALLILKRQRGEHECTIFVTGRDIEEEREIAITADVANKVWLNHGNAVIRQIGQERQQVLDLLKRHPDGLRPRQIADALGKPSGTVRILIWRMLDDDQLHVDDGRYCAGPSEGERKAS